MEKVTTVSENAVSVTLLPNGKIDIEPKALLLSKIPTLIKCLKEIHKEGPPNRYFLVHNRQPFLSDTKYFVERESYSGVWYETHITYRKPLPSQSYENFIPDSWVEVTAEEALAAIQ